MPSKASIKRLLAGEKIMYTNETNRPIDLILQSAGGISVRTSLAIGQSIELRTGEAVATLYLLEPEEPARTLQLVPGGSGRAAADH